MASSHEGDFKIADFIIEGAAKAKADGILFQVMISKPILFLQTKIMRYEKFFICLKKIGPNSLIKLIPLV